jgi:mannan endo-1,4-beta-mannosidase
MKIISIATGIAIAASSAQAAIVANWNTCQFGDTCASAGYACCVSPADVSTMKLTCRPTSGGYCINNSPSGTSVGDWVTCYQGDSCSGASYGMRCCVSNNDIGSGKSTCRSGSDCSTLRIAANPSRYRYTALASGQKHAAFRSFGGASSYFLHATSSTAQDAVLAALQNAKVKVVRVFIARFYANEKNTGNAALPDIEPNVVGTFDNTQLNSLNGLMLRAYNRGIKLIIAPHDRYMLGTYKVDAYAQKYLGMSMNNQPGGPSYPHRDVRALYTNSNFNADIDRRYAYVANYPNPNFGNRRIGDIHEAIFGFDMQNEPQAYADGNKAYCTYPSNPQWVCQRATALKSLLHPNIVTISGGGGKFNDSTIKELFTCNNLDVIALHSYNEGDFKIENLASVTNAAILNRKRLIVEEFAGYGGSGKAEQLRRQISNFNSFGIPWVMWQVTNPGNANDFETYTTETTAWSNIANGANTANSLSTSTAKFPFI